MAQGINAPWRKLKELEASSGARIGVAAIDTGNGLPLFWRENERFVMCSTFKLMAAAAVLARVDAVTVEDVREVAAELLTRPMSLAVVGPFDGRDFAGLVG